MRQFLSTFVVIIVFNLFFVSGCSLFQVYHAPTEEGVVVASGRLSELSAGMSKQEVLDIIGSPLIRDPLMPDQWLYPYTKTENGLISDKQLVIVYFENDAYVSYEIKRD